MPLRQAGASLASRVLIADTDAELRQRLSSRLLDIDVFSDCVGNAADALARLDGAAYSLVIADVGLASPGIEQIVARVAAIEPLRRPIVLVAAANSEAARSLDVEIVQIVLRRPLDVPQIVDLIGNCVRSLVAPRRDFEARATERGDRPIQH